MRRVATSNEFFDILDKIGNGKFVTIGYVSAANLDVPKVSKRNPLTNRMKGYPDYSVFGNGDEIGALVKITTYNMQYLNRSTVSKKYGEFKQSANGIRGEYGLDPIGSKESYKSANDWSKNGLELYKGANDELRSHSYNPQNIYGVKPKSVIYTVGTDGHILNALSQEQIIPYLKKKREVDGVAALRKMNVEDAKIQEYIEKINNLKFKYINFESDSILWIAATIDGEKIVYINDNLSRAVDGINIQPQDFRAIARERYNIGLKDLTEMKRISKEIIRLTESELKKVITESVRSVLAESSFKNNQSYTHFAVNKETNKIVNGWDYRGYDSNELRQFKKDYFIVDLVDYGWNPKNYKIVGEKYLLRNGIDPNNNANWANS